MLWGLPALQRRVVSIEEPEVIISTNTMVDGPSPKLDQQESSHSRTLHVINDALLNMIDYML